MRVSVRVHPTIREFIVETNGSDIITPNKDDLLWKQVKANLTTYNENNISSKDNDASYVYIELLDSASVKSFTAFNREKGKNYIYIDPLFRCFLTKRGENEIAKELRKRFKNSFHTFVMGALVGNPKLQQKEAFDLFIEKFNLSLNEITYEMLKKSWDRSIHKKSLFDDKLICTILF